MVEGDRLLTGQTKFAEMQPSWWWVYILFHRNLTVTLYCGRRVLKSLCLSEFVITLAHSITAFSSCSVGP